MFSREDRYRQKIQRIVKTRNQILQEALYREENKNKPLKYFCGGLLIFTFMCVFGMIFMVLLSKKQDTQQNLPIIKPQLISW